MQVVVTGFALWLAVLLVLVRMLRIGAEEWLITRRQSLCYALCLIGAVLVLFRPHEDIFGGQDQGAYVNSALTYVREGALSYRDPLFARALDAEDSFLYYGHANPRMRTRLGVLQLPTPGKATMRPWFQPAYSVLMSPVARLASRGSVLYVTPVFALLSAFALWTLARLLLGSPWAGFTAALLYVVSPVVAWHARTARPEFAASFLVLAALVLLVDGWRTRGRRAWTDAVLAYGCLGLAPFFHITAWFAVPGALLTAVLLILAGREEFLAAPVVLAVALWGFTLQTYHLTDCYRLGAVLDPLAAHAVGSAVVAAVIWTALAGGCVLAKRSRRRRGMKTAGYGQADALWPWTSGLLGLGTCAVLAILFVWPELAGLRLFGSGGAAGSVRLIDVRPFVAAVSAPVALLGLLGWPVFVMRDGETRLPRLAAAAVLVPGILLAGRMPILMYFVRRAVPFLMPALALALASLVMALATARRWGGRYAALAAAFALAVLSVRGRTHLYWQTDYRGYVDSLRRVAETVRRQDGILLCEYSRIAAPMNHFFGVPTLGLDNEHVPDYGRAERVWENIMRSGPDRPAFFATPFPEAPVSDRFAFEPVGRVAYRGTRLVEMYGRLPRGTALWENSISLYRMRVRPGSGASLPPGEFPFTACIGCGNMGWRGFERRVVADAEMTGIPTGPGRPARWRLPEVVTADAAEIVFFVFDRSGSLMAPQVRIAGAARLRASDGIALSADWWAGRVAGVYLGAEGTVSLETDRPALVAGVLIAPRKDRPPVAAVPVGETAGWPRDPFLAGVAREDAGFLVPRPVGAGGWLLVHVNAAAGTLIELRNEQGRAVGSAHAVPPAGGWTWLGWPLEQLALPAGFNWLSAVGVSGSDNRQAAAPAVLLRCVAVLP